MSATAVYAAAPQYLDLGWQGVLPLPIGAKATPPDGFTGRDGADPSPEQVAAWIAENPYGNLALRVPDGVVGLDVDAYGRKRGGVSFAELEAEHGPLPATWHSSSRVRGRGEDVRPDHRSGIRWFQVPPGTRLKGAPRPGIEIVQRHHRYAVVWPSVHPEGGTYEWWYDLDARPDVEGDGNVVRFRTNGDRPQAVEPPRPEQLPWLPEPWIEALRARSSGEGEGPGDLHGATGFGALTERYVARAKNGASCHDTALALGCQLRDNGCLLDDALRVFGPVYFEQTRSATDRESYSLAEVQKAFRDVYASEARDPLPGFDAPDADDLPVVVVNVDRPELLSDVRRTVEEVNARPTIFVHGDVLCRIGRDDEERPIVKALDAHGLRPWLARRVRFVRETWDPKAEKLKRSPSDPPNLVLDDLLSYPDELRGHGVPVLDYVASAPVFGANGTLVQEAGYHPAARVWYEPGDLVVPPVSDHPPPEELAEAVRWLTVELLEDFPFETPADRAHALALVVTPFVRPMISGPTPLFAYDAPTIGTGKGLCAQACLLPALGDRLAANALPGTDDEIRKRLTAALVEGRQVVLFDNVRQVIDSGSLASALTTTVWEDRFLGQSRQVHLPVRCLWVVTGNNLQTSDEIARRSVRVRLDADSETPWRREKFRHPHLLEWAAEHRGRLVWAALTLVSAWEAAGRPEYRGTPLGSFEAWSRTVGGILEHAGSTGFLANVEAVYDELAVEDDADFVVRFLERWHAKHGATDVPTADLVALATDNPLDPAADVFGLARLAGRPASNKLATELRDLRGRIVRGWRVDKGRRRRTWRVTPPQGGVTP